MDHISQIDSYSETITSANQNRPARRVGPILEPTAVIRGATMRSHWIIAGLLTTVIAAGCNGRNNENAQNTGQNEAVAPAGASAGTEHTGAPSAPPPGAQPT